MNYRELVGIALDALRVKKNRKKILFLHIPKCGGTSLRNAISATYGLRQLVTPNCVNFLDAGSAGYAAAKTGLDVYEFRDVLLAYWFSIPRSRFISGHFALYGNGSGPLSKDWEVITLLREPISKFISGYKYNRYFRNPAHVWREDGVSYMERVEADIEDFLNTDYALEFGSDFVRQITKCSSVSDAYRDDVIKETIERLEAMRLVGVLEHLERFVSDFERIFEVRLRVPHVNKSPAKRANGIIVTDELRKRIAEISEPNIQIYEHFLRRA